MDKGLLGNNPELASFLGFSALFIGVLYVTIMLFIMPKSRRVLLSLLIVGCTFIKKPFYQETFFQYYRGVDRGFGVTIPDLLFLGFFIFILVGGRNRKIIWWPPNTGNWWILIGISLISLWDTEQVMLGLFSVYKFIRAYILYWVIVNYVRDREDVDAVIRGLVAAVIFQGVVVFWTKYITHTAVSRSMGSFNHPNSLGMFLDIGVPILVALLFSGVFKKQENFAVFIALVAGFISAMFTKSRAVVLALPAAMIGVSGISLLSRPNYRKIKIITAGLVVFGILVALALPKIIRRFQNAPKESATTRVYFNDAAIQMADDNFWGVGINRYPWALANTEYYWMMYPDYENSEDPIAFRASIFGQTRLGNAHNIYLLLAAEVGWLGMGIFIILILRFYMYNIKLFFKARNRYYKAILLGMLAGFAIFHVQGVLEWVFLQTGIIFIYFIFSGLLVAIGNLEAEESKAEEQGQKSLERQIS